MTTAAAASGPRAGASRVTPDAGLGHRRWRPTRWALRTRLVAVLIVLLALVCVSVSAATTIALHRYQVRQLDTQLLAAAARAPHGGPGPFVGEPFAGRCTDATTSVPTALRFLQAPGVAPGTLGASTSTTGALVAGRLDDSGCFRALPAAGSAALAHLVADHQPRTVDVPGLGWYRVVAVHAPDDTTGADDTDDTTSAASAAAATSTASAVIVTGLPMAGLEATQRRLAAVEVAVCLVALVLAGLVGTVVVRRTLRPLQRVAATAALVSALPLDRGEVALDVRVPPRDTDPGTEVGQVGAALDRLLGHVGSALAARAESEAQVRQFVADASHELRNPLAAIRGYSELVLQRPQALPEQAAHAIGRVQAEAERMSGLVEDLLLLARLDAGRPLQREAVDLTRLVLDAVSDAAAGGRDHTWRLDVPEEPVEVVGDDARLRQVLANLLANARTHTPAGTTVTVSLSVRPGAGYVVLAVLDDGPGIPAVLLPRVFDRFARADSSRSRAAGSTGLGLAIVAAIVEAHGGSVDVTSRPGQTAFLVHLPVPGAGAPGTGAGPAQLHSSATGRP